MSAVDALQSELGFLVDSVVSHIQTAGTSIQWFNLLALVSARVSTQLLTSYSQFCDRSLFALCQALDVRAMNLLIPSALERCLDAITTQVLEPLFGDKARLRLCSP